MDAWSLPPRHPPLLALQSSPAVLAGVLLPPSPLTSLDVSGSTISNTISTMTHQLLPSCRPRNPNAHSELPPGYLQSISKPTRLKPSPQPSQPAPLQAPISADNNAILQLLGPQTWHLLCLLSFTSSTAHLSSRFCRLHLPQFWNWSMSHLLHDHHLARPTSPLQSIVTQSSMVAWPRPRHLQSVRYFYCSVSLSTRRQLHQAGLSLFTDRGVASTYCRHTAGTQSYWPDVDRANESTG